MSLVLLLNVLSVAEMHPFDIYACDELPCYSDREG